MDTGQILSWVVSIVGLTGFYFSGRKVWWAWYINFFCQILWFSYALVTNQPAFLVTAAVYSVIFGINAYRWTKEHRAEQKRIAARNTSIPKPRAEKILHFDGTLDSAREICNWIRFNSNWFAGAYNQELDTGQTVIFVRTFNVDGDKSVHVFPGESIGMTIDKNFFFYSEERTDA